MLLYYIVIGVLLLICIMLIGWLFLNANKAEEAYGEHKKIINPHVPDTLEAIDWG